MSKSIWEQKYQGRGFDKSVDPWERLLAWTPEMVDLSAHSEYYQEDDDDAPFFSETYLYNLLGKEDARTLLALLRQAATAVGVDIEAKTRAVYEGYDDGE